MTTPVAVSGTYLSASISCSESELVTRLRASDDEAYKQLFRTHTGALLAVARRFFGDAEADEAVQDAFVSAFKGIDRFAGTSRLGTWLHRITVNACLIKLRGRKRQRFVPLDDTIPARTATGEDVSERAETCERVRAGVDRLPRPYREVVRLRDLEGLNTEETADRLGTSEAVVKVRLHRARQALRALLEPGSAR
jgi:RNA polymerase sigma-70 factor (ECF subfamily)